MAVMLGNLYGALRDAGMPDETGQKAAEEVAAFEDDISALVGDVTLIKWMVGFGLAPAVSRLGILLRGMR